GRGLSFQVAIQSLMSFSRAWTEVWTPRRISLPVSRPNHRSTWFIHDEPVGVGCLAFSGQLNWYYFMLRAAGPGTRRGPLEGSGNREPNGDEPDYTGVRCSGQYPPWPFSASGRRYDGPARL